MSQVNFGALSPYIPQLLAGLWLTILISGAAVAISLPLGLGGALLRTSRYRVLRTITAAYVQVVRNVPLVLILFLVFFELANAGFPLPPAMAAVAALSINGSAYATEIFRGGLAGIPPGQYEAAYSLGFRPVQVFRYVVLPQLMLISFPALGNQVVGTVLASSVVFFVGVEELSSATNQIGSKTFRYFEVFMIAGLMYVIAAQAINFTWVRVGRRWTVTESARKAA